MRGRVKRAAVVLVVLLAVVQLIRPDRVNPPTDEKYSIEAQPGTSSGLVAVLDRACGDCHSNRTIWPWYTEVAPLSWLMAYGVREGRKVVNFSEWAAYSSDTQRALLTASCRSASEGTMPGSYTLVRPETRLSADDVETICAAARESQRGPSIETEPPEHAR